jgi:hypothetical protein
MKDDASKNRVNNDPNTFEPAAGTPLKPAGSVTVRHEDKPREGPDEVRRIHPRRPLPTIPDSSPDDSSGGSGE